MDPMGQLFLATVLFVAAHFVPSLPLRARLARALGEKGYLALYSLVALATLGWMIHAYLRAPLEPLWPGLRLLPAIAMPFALVLLACGVLSPNPSALGSSKLLAGDEPARGILRITRHPVQWGILLWAAAHLLARGDLKSAIFFGGFCVLSALGTVLIDRRKEAALGEPWQRFARATSNVPFAAIVQGRNRLVLGEIGWTKPLAGLAAYAALFAAHPWLFGARPY